VVAFRQSVTHAKVDAVEEKVATSNGVTIGQMVEANEQRHVAAGDPPAQP